MRYSWAALSAVLMLSMSPHAFAQIGFGGLESASAAYLRICTGARADTEECVRLWQNALQERSATVNTRDIERLSRGCYPLRDRVLTSNPPQSEWICP